MSMQKASDTKLNQIVQQYFSKAAQIIVQSRIADVNSLYSSNKGAHKLNKWFNIQLEDLEPFKEELKLWRTLDYQSPVIPRLVVETFLDHKRLPADHDLELIDANGKAWTVDKYSTRKEVVLERWILTFDPETQSAVADELPVIYTNVMILMRSLFTYTRLMPSWSLRNKLSSLSSSPLTLGCSIINASNGISSKGRIGLSKPIKSGETSELETYEFGLITTHIGAFHISVNYRTECDFITLPASGEGQTLPLDLLPALKMGVPTTARSSSTSSSNSLQQSSPTKQTSEGNSYMASRHNEYKNHSKAHSTDFAGIDNPAALAIIYGSGSTGRTSPVDLSLYRRRSVTFREKDYNHSESAGHSNTLNIPSSSPISTKPPISFHPFKTPSLSASPSNDTFVSSTSVTGSKPISFSRTTSNSSLAALRIPNRSLSNASNTPLVGSYVKHQSVGSAGGLDRANQPFNETAILSSSASSSRSGSISRFSSSFGSRTGQWTRNGSSSGTRPKRSSFSGEPGSLGSAIASSASSSLEPGSGFLLNDDDGLDSFVKALDSIANPLQPNSSSSILLSGRGNRNSNNSLFFTSNKSTLSSSPLSSTGVGCSNSLEMGAENDLENDKLSRFRHVKESHMALSDSMHSSQIGKNVDRSSTGGVNNLFSFPMSPPALQRNGSSHTPSKPSRLSQGYTADGAYRSQYYSHPRKQESRSSLTNDDELGMIVGQGETQDNHDVSNFSPTRALDIPTTHAARVQRRESSSYTSRPISPLLSSAASGSSAAPKYHDTSNMALPNHSQDKPGFIVPGKELTNFRTSTTLSDNNYYTRRFSETGSDSGFAHQNRRGDDINGLTSQFRGMDIDNLARNKDTRLDDHRHTSSLNSRGILHMARPSRAPSGRADSISNPLSRSSSPISTSTASRMRIDNEMVQPGSARSTNRFSYYHQTDQPQRYRPRLDDDDDDDDDEMMHHTGYGPYPKKPTTEPDSSLVPFDEDLFLPFEMNCEEYGGTSEDKPEAGGTPELRAASNGGPGSRGVGAENGGRLGYRSANMFDPLSWEE